MGGEKAVEQLKTVGQEAEQVEEQEEQMTKASANPATEPTYGNKHIHAQKWQDHGHTVRADGQELLGGVLPKDMVLPAAIGFLGVVILGVFIAGRK